MNIVVERTRIIFTEYNPIEKRKIEDLAATEDKAFVYQDPDDKMICFPPGLLDDVKKVFPDVKIEDRSKEYWDYERIQSVEHNATPRNQLQIDFINFLLNNANNKENAAGILSPGTGKGLPISTLIPTPNGYKLMGNINVGDKVFGSDGRPTTVLGVFPQGVKNVYRITFNDGRSVLCDEDHLWSAYTNGCRCRQHIFETKNMIRDYKIYTPSNAANGRDPYIYRYRIPLLSAPVQYNHRDVKINPYVIGALIGNGCLTSNFHLIISSGDDFVPCKIAEICNFTVRKTSQHNYNYGFYYNKKNPITGKAIPVHTKDFLKDYPELIDYSRNKKIPDDYMYNDYDTRMELLRGLMDTDGSITYSEGRFNVSYSSCSEVLLKQIQELIWGLGYICSISTPDKRVDKYVNGYFSQVNIRVPQIFKQRLFTHPKKLELAKLAANRDDFQQPFRHLIIKNIEYVGKEETQCIYVDADDHLYLTEKFIVTHNTFMACYSAIKVGYRTLIIAPTSGVKAQWVDTLVNMFNVPAERVLTVNTPKQFINVKADFVVISQASLASLNKTYDLEAVMKNNKFGIKIIDEVQMWFHNIIKVDGNSNICLNWYLTGTFGRSGDEENALYQKMFGKIPQFREKMKNPTIFNRKPGNIYGAKPHTHCTMIWGHSGLSAEEIKSVSNSIRYNERSNKWVRYGLSVPEYMKLVIPDDGHMTKFLKMCLNVIKKAETKVTYGKTLILVSTISNIMTIDKYVSEMFPDKNIGVIHSKQSKDINTKVKAECEMIISTVSSCGTGFDVKDLSKLIVLAPFKSWVLTSQVRGRLRVRDDGKDTYMWDVVDADVKQLRAWANNRASVLQKECKVFKVVDMD
jgi:superfamily II DNA or RNA helicase